MWKALQHETDKELVLWNVIFTREHIFCWPVAPQASHKHVRIVILGKPRNLSGVVSHLTREWSHISPGGQQKVAEESVSGRQRSRQEFEAQSVPLRQKLSLYLVPLISISSVNYPNHFLSP